MKLCALSLSNFINLFKDELLFGLSNPIIIESINIANKTTYILFVNINIGIKEDEITGPKKPTLKP
ncbi:hypothetical protein XNC1_p0090 (plasmid) [Xenorhabdus nematophila ATCC 19061]|uniref:Uncharacterized protein n=1 Tax=Xenorhabdus nematophila (strain ATCC 19061 / DSM 3370 / CCUG 14189 / LMG 1036 / NCIMB 9965 / AN6) TaxID=406817 RepID=D3VM06_XENNA|nr:hypothetical protein XNC1_p0090 [Xenorhabdus nematophila ATCC 19061]CEK25574.1 conserved protein of unknown function [Xenorhabdus nematophila AN6/1]